MPFKTKTFYGDVQIGDFTLNRQQMNDILETEIDHPLGKEQINKIMQQENPQHRDLLRRYGLEDFKKIEIVSKFKDPEYLLYARRIKHNRRASKIIDNR